MGLIEDLISLGKLRALRVLALTALIVTVGTECFIMKLSVLDPDIWWHVSVGSWIVHHRSWPQTGIFSRTAANHTWRAYSWGYEVLLSRAYEWSSFIGVCIFGTVVTVAVALAVFWMLNRLSGRFWLAWALSIFTYSAFLFTIAPRPVFFTAVLFTITLTLVLDGQKSGRVQLLYWLPLIFLVWANCHIQFIYGIATVGLFAGVNLLQRAAMWAEVYPECLLKPTLPLAPVFAVFVCCVMASCIGPYSFHLYQVVFGYGTSKIIYKMLIEFQSPNFYTASQYIELLLALGAYFAVGWQKKIDPFKLALLIFASIFAFRTIRDGWFLCIPAVAVMADLSGPDRERDQSIRLASWAGVALASVLFLLLVVRNTDFNPAGIDRTISASYPVDAVNFLRRNPAPGPLYNNFDWGGFLIFYLPEYPVSIDGRTDLYGDDMVTQAYDSQQAEASYATDPYLNEAGVVLLANKDPLAQLLPTDLRFRVIYRDNLAVVLVRKAKGVP